MPAVGASASPFQRDARIVMVVVAHLNVRSVASDGRLSEIGSLLSFHNIDILCLSETWLKPHHMSSALLISGYQPLLRRDRPVERGGGVAIYLRDGFACKRLYVVPDDIECLALEICLPHRKSLRLLAIDPQVATWTFSLTPWML